MIQLNKFFLSFTKIILIILPILSGSANAGWSDFWRDFTACFTDPCNCGRSQQSDIWQRDPNFKYPIANPPDTIPQYIQYTYRYKTFKNCPPYDKFSGREGCLKQYLPPVYSTSNGSWRATCAEASKNSSYKKPVIKLRMQACNAFACFSKTKDLDARKGECVSWPTQYALPTIRHCARVAIPRISYDERGELIMEPDEGYQFHFLDSNGFPWPDTGVKANVNNNERVFLPKICLYEDPSFWTGISGTYRESYRNRGLNFDVNDTNENRMPYHTKGPGANNSKINWFETITFSSIKNTIIEEKFFYQGRSNYLPFSRGSYTPHKETYGQKEIDFKWKIDSQSYLSWIHDFVEKKSGSLGCTYLPIGPLPPKFCQIPVKLAPAPVIEEICPLEYVFVPGVASNSNIQDESSINVAPGSHIFRYRPSTISNPCVRSSVRNNFIHNSFRISMDNFINLCGEGDDFLTKECVKILPTGTTPAMIHALGDELPKCSTDRPAPTDLPCVLAKESLRPECPANANCKYRIVYSYREGDSFIQSDGYPEDAPVKGIIGVNIGKYRDVSFNLKEANQDQLKGSYIEKEIVDLSSTTTNNSLKVIPVITHRGYEYNTPYGDLELPGNSLCGVLEGDQVDGSKSKTIIGCTKRAPSAPFNIRNITGDNFNPQAILEVGYESIPDNEWSNEILDKDVIKTDKISAVIAALDLRDGNKTNSNKSEPTSTNPSYNILGLEIATIITDDRYKFPPYTETRISGQSSEPGLTIFGTYKDNIMPGPNVSNPKYIRDLEYYNGEYMRGGKKFTAYALGYNKCHEMIVGIDSSSRAFDDSNCVLAKLKHSDKVNCKEFLEKDAKIRCPVDMSCKKEQINCEPPILKSSIQVNNGGGVIKFYEDQDKIICYETTLDGEVCQPSTDPREREIPERGVIGKINGYYDTEVSVVETVSSVCKSTAVSEKYNSSQCGVRDKTPIEMGETLPIPDLPKCSASNTPNQDAGYATWSEAGVGGNSIGTCMQGCQSTASLTRLCYLDGDNRPVLDTPSSSCICRKCSEEKSTQNSTKADWPSVFVGEYSVPQCGRGLSPPKGGFTPRKCIYDETSRTEKFETPKEGEFCFNDGKSINISGGDLGKTHSLLLTSDYQLRPVNISGSGRNFSVKIGKQSDWDLIDQQKMQEINWIEKAKDNNEIREMNIKIQPSSLNNVIKFNNLKFYVNGEIVSLGLFEGVNKKAECKEVSQNGFSTCSEFKVGQGQDFETVIVLKIQYKSNNPDLSTGAMVSFDVEMPEGATYRAE